MTGNLFNLMPVHDLQDFVPDPLAPAALTATPHSGQEQADNLPRFRTAVPVQGGQLYGQPLLGVTQFPGLGIVIALPVQLPDGRKAEPNKKKRQAVRFSANPVEQIMAQVETVHQGPGVAPHFSGDNLIGHLDKYCSFKTAFLIDRRLNRDIKIPLLPLQPLSAIGQIEHKSDARRRLFPRPYKLQPVEPLGVRKQCLRRPVVNHFRFHRAERSGRRQPFKSVFFCNPPVQNQPAGDIGDQTDLKRIAFFQHCRCQLPVIR